MNARSSFRLFLALTCLALSLHAADVTEILKASGGKGGFAVHIGGGDGAIASSLHAAGPWQILLLKKDPSELAAVRQFLTEKGCHGPVSANTWDGANLPFIENLVNLLIIDEGESVPPAEINRVLVPEGVALIREGNAWKSIVKPRNPDLDDWTHYYYDSRGNAVSQDKVVGPPTRLQWVGSPRWSRHHDRMSSLSAMVSGKGRLFYIMDEGSRISILLPPKWTVMARDAFNGCILWKKEIKVWNNHLWPLKSGPTQLTRRLVTDGDNVFLTQSIGEPVTRLDAATGETTMTYEATKGAEEILHRNGILYVLSDPGTQLLSEFAPYHNTGDQKRVETEFNWDGKPRQLMAVEASSGKVLWQKEQTVAPLTLATDGKWVAFSDGQQLVTLTAKDGQPTSDHVPAEKKKLYEYNYGPRLVLHDDLILYAGGDGSMKGVDAASGKELWKAPHEKSGYRSPEDLMVAQGLVWNAGTLSGNQSGEFIGRDPMTGEVKKQFPPDVNCYWFHHRCYIAKGTENFLMPSRTGIEYVDMAKESWDINHWVRGACLYGVLPANGLTYAGPHNCACYPEAKLDGMNALASPPQYPLPPLIPEQARLEKGPAYAEPVDEVPATTSDWPTYRADNTRSGNSQEPLLENLDKNWEIDLPGKLSAMTIAANKVFISQVDAHTLHALDARTGEKLWQFIAGGRIDSPPTYVNGRLFFGGRDGVVYALRASDGALLWRFHAAPRMLNHFAFENLESVSPVHGSVLVENDIISLVAGRSCFLDGGLRFIRLNAITGEKLIEEIYDDKDPDTGADLQSKHQTLQMPVALNDILSSDGTNIWLRSQKINHDGKRLDIGPVSGDAVKQGAAQRGEGAHLFAPMGFLDDSWFHRSYWVYGKSFAGGHSGYYQAGKFTPAGRILVHDDKTVYAYGREAKYLKWTTTMEHSLFAASKEAPAAPEPVDPQKQNNKLKGIPPLSGAATFPDNPLLDPAEKPLTMEIWCFPDGPNGLLVQQGGPLHGYSLEIHQGKPRFSLRRETEFSTIMAPEKIGEGWHHIVATLSLNGTMTLYLDGDKVAEGNAKGTIPATPKNPLTLGNSRLNVGEGETNSFQGLLDQFTLYHRALDLDEIRSRFDTPDAKPEKAVLHSSFDNDDARDDIGKIHGVLNGVDTGKGRVGAALWFRGNPSNNKPSAGKQGAESLVQRQWDRYVPIVTRSMALAGGTVIVAGPPDTLDEEYAFERLTQKDPNIQAELIKQDEALEGKSGAKLMAVDGATGEEKAGIDLDSPPVWDGMAVAQGSIFVATTNGKVIRFGKPIVKP